MKIAPQKAALLSGIFIEGKVFGAIDSNLDAWLQEEWEATDEMEVVSINLKEHTDNKELINSLEGEEEILKKTLQPQQIKYLIENDLLQKNGLSNLFFVYSQKENKIFILGVVWDESINRFVPYIYRTHNVYRAWTKGNIVFIRKF